ncbi:unnamed protein product [Cylindrotheca closterium]|uniref:Phosphatase PP2A regulatory subunit A/Splicing factor 3B subunit 1-like HEAT repeat domain-containing protein n=1 Tax=Cylindrotheca closterium TaxID=2856 RepID=A0AAD2FIU4_9STRA|nr:unnamed protein product [Cylindrotheca closterium]
MDEAPMDVDPVDDGPRHMTAPLPMTPTPATAPADNMSKEEEARHSIEMLRGDDVSARVAAASRLESIASVLGEERTRQELLPFITDGADDEDEVLLAIAGSLGKLVRHVGGNDHAHNLLPPLELLLSVEEASVREAAFASMKTVSESLPENTFRDQYEKVLSRLAKSEWFTARMSSAGLICSAYPRFTSEQQKVHLSLFTGLCQDDTPMARRVAAQNLGEMIRNVVESNGRETLALDGIITTSLIPLYEELASNDQPDSVRLQTTHNCVIFGHAMGTLAKTGPLQANETALIQRLVPLIMATIDDRSWRVRWTAASKFAEVIGGFDALPSVMDSLIPAYEKLLQDPEAEVRTAATFNLAAVAKNCTTPVPVPPIGRMPTEEEMVNYQGERVSAAERLVKRVTSLTEDDSEHVRAALAMVATELAPILGKDATIIHLVPPILLLLRDAASEVRLNLISSLGALNEVIGVDLLSQSLLPAILDLAQDGKWRIRLAILQHMPLLAKQLGRDFFTEKLSSICVGWLGDDIASIRAAAANNLAELTKLFGTDWACEYLIPSVDDIRLHPSYLRRLTAVQACSKMAMEMDPGMASIEILPIILEMATDTVPNIRFNVAKELGKLSKVFDQNIFDQQIYPILTLLMDDPDRDVQFFAKKASKRTE